MEIRPSALPAHAEDLCDAMNVALNQKWGEKRGLQVVSIAMNPISLPEQDQEDIKKAQRAAAMANPLMGAGYTVISQGDAMGTAAANPNGAMMGFMGMNAVNGTAGGMNAASLYAMGQQQAAAAQAAAPVAPAPAAPAAESWKCTCGATATGKFCPECGSPKPAAPAGWTCKSCGAVNKGKFCTECGAKKPAEEPLYRCAKCGWEPADPKHPPKFCPECGDPFDDNDVQ